MQVLRLYQENIIMPDTKILVTIDDDDMSMNDRSFWNPTEQIEYEYGRSDNKVHACNRGLKNHYFDIVILASDDMMPQVKGFDQIISDAMLKRFPDTDGCLHFNDGYTGERLQTMPIFGRKYYERFNYIYNPSYVSLWCDNEQMEVAKGLNKYAYFTQILFKHEHYANNPEVKMDERYKITESFYLQDKRTYEKRKEAGFDL